MTDDTPHQRTLEIGDDPHLPTRLFGPQDATRKLLERRLAVRLSARSGALTINGESTRLAFAERALRQLIALAQRGQSLFLQEVEQVVRALEQDPTVQVDALSKAPELTTHELRAIAAAYREGRKRRAEEEPRCKKEKRRRSGGARRREARCASLTSLLQSLRFDSGTSMMPACSLHQSIRRPCLCARAMHSHRP